MYVKAQGSSVVFVCLYVDDFVVRGNNIGEMNQLKLREKLPPQLRVWHKILMGCINPRPPSSSSDYVNANQKYMLYYLMSHQKMCLPSIMFYYLRDSVRKTRTTADESKKVPNYISFGSLLSDIFVESGLVKFLEEAQLTLDLKVIAGDVVNVRNLKNMGVFNKVYVDPTMDSSEDILGRI